MRYTITALILMLALLTLGASAQSTAAPAATPSTAVAASPADAAALATAQAAVTSSQQALGAAYKAFATSPATLALQQTAAQARETLTGLLHSECAKYDVDCTSPSGYVYSVGNQAFIKGAQRGTQGRGASALPIQP